MTPGPVFKFSGMSGFIQRWFVDQYQETRFQRMSFGCFEISDTYSYFKANTGFFPDTLTIWNKIVKSDIERSRMAAKMISHHETVV